MPIPVSDHFWKIIHDARENMENPMDSLDPDLLQQQLEELGDDEIKGFMREYYQALINLNQWPVWGAGYIIAGGMSDDGFHYFRSWLIGRGREAYETALAQPEKLGAFVEDGDECENELLEYVALELLESRGIEEDPREDLENSADDEPAGDQWDEDSVYRLFPTLSARFG